MKKGGMALVLCLTAGLLAGCAGKSGKNTTFDPGFSSIYVTREGTFRTATVESYEEKDYYSEEDLKVFLESAAREFNGEHGEGAAALASCSLEKGIARMIFDYSSGENLTQFVREYQDTENTVDSIGVMSLEEAAAGVESDGIQMVNPSDGKPVTVEELKKSGRVAVAVEAQNPVTVQTEGKILYVSEGVTLRDSFTAKIDEGKNYIIFK